MIGSFPSTITTWLSDRLLAGLHIPPVNLPRPTGQSSRGELLVVTQGTCRTVKVEVGNNIR